MQLAYLTVEWMSPRFSGTFAPSTPEMLPECRMIRQRNPQSWFCPFHVWKRFRFVVIAFKRLALACMHDCLDVAGHTFRCVTSTCIFRSASLLMSCPWIYLFPFRCDAKIINLLVSCTIETGPRTKQNISWLIKWMELYKSLLSSFTLFSPQTCIRISLEIPEREKGDKSALR